MLKYPHLQPTADQKWAEAKLSNTTNLFVINTFSHGTCFYTNHPFIGSENVNLIMAFGNLVALSLQSNISFLKHLINS
jgi:hypothetical protein